MKRFSLLLLCALFVQNMFAQEAAEKNLVKSLDAAGAKVVVFEFKHKEIKPSVVNSGMMKLDILVKSNMPDVVLDQLVKAGRYTIDSKTNADGSLSILMPNLEKAVTIKGQDLQEEIIVQAGMPIKYILNGNKLELESALMASRDKSGKMKGGINVMKPKYKSSLKAQPKGYKLKPGDIMVGGKPLDIK